MFYNKEVELIICRGQCHNLVEGVVREHVELIKKHGNNIRGKDCEGIYNLLQMS